MGFWTEKAEWLIRDFLQRLRLGALKNARVFYGEQSIRMAFQKTD